ncbi:hypothetical protein IC620_12130 [Hazenella sp. IB182357]|uniref:Uncharacterized protein n=1 Tax=Polycladospora coralii TaxID=2771432 RepID=A0A926NAS6_9BACL|nr:hypothetical protein [Polycladospora coralii]MBD1373102.1 hypothetical protein [Polycladospora coralii]MBS7529553.1 hypothetical protein [Polycladospora coralii]
MLSGANGWREAIPTSALDRASCRTLYFGKTVMVFAHRPASIGDVDHILVIMEGEVHHV